uniref:Aldehyde oxidase/xanthine dehydrogenase a/b hammerhead domain-containing protein n=1 Tax=Leptobrachium leishanense TaxID=445787 RepID=A0A8C5QCP0_9ANUR
MHFLFPDTFVLHFLGSHAGFNTVILNSTVLQSTQKKHYPVTACLLPICSLNNMAVTTTEGIGNSARLHPVQERIAKAHGSQCGFCTPGMVMSMYALLRNHPEPTMSQIMDALSGNLCRCTGYRPILDGCKTFSKASISYSNCCLDKRDEENDLPELKNFPLLFNEKEFLPLDKTQELIFPPELIGLNFLIDKLMIYSCGGLTYKEIPGFAQAKHHVQAPGDPAWVFLSSPGLPAEAYPCLSLLKRQRDPANSGSALLLFLTEVSWWCANLLFQNQFILRIQDPSVYPWITVVDHPLTSLIQVPLSRLPLGGPCLQSRTALPTIHGLSLDFIAISFVLLPAVKDHLCFIKASALRESCLASPLCRRLRLIFFFWTFVFWVYFIYCTCLLQEIDTKQPAQDPVGRPIVHLSGIKHATGEAVYVDDMPPVDQELFIAFATSTRAHAKILSIDETEARKVPGVVDIIRAKDVPGKNAVDALYPTTIIFLWLQVECVGQIICAVVADTSDHARRAAGKIKIAYEDIEPAIITIEDAIKYKSFYEPFKGIKHGNAEEAFKTADHILEGEVHICGQEQFYMETNSLIVIPKGEENEFDIYVSTQAISTSQFAVAAVLGVPSNRIMSKAKRVGGAFGGKATKPAIFASAAAVAAQKTKRPIRCVLERGEDMLITAGRHPVSGKYKVGCMNDGKIVAADVSFYSNAGCTIDESILVLEVALVKMDNAYNFPNLNCRAIACKTNLPSNTAFRGFGFPQTGLVTETIMDAIAIKCRLPSYKVRERNLYRGICRTHYNQEFDSTNLKRCWEECMQMSSYHKRRAEIQEFNKKTYWKKKGMAMIPLKFTVGYIEKAFHQAAALVHIYSDGNCLISHGGIEMGQGLHTKIIQIASRELNIPMSSIYICETNVACVPNSIPSAGTFGTDVYGMAVKEACETLMKRLEPIIAQNPNGTWNEWVMGAFLQKVSLSATGYFNGYNTYMDWEKGEGHAGPYYLFGAACSEIELDCLTGAHKNLRTDIVVDVGQSINPGIDLGQVEGAFAQGVGLYTMEQLHYSPEGVLYTRGPDQYKMPTVSDVPTEFYVSFLAGSQNPYTIYSSKGVGEVGVFFGCSVFFAIKDAINSAREERGLSNDLTFNSPMVPEKVRMACADDLTNMVCGHNI